jgi:5'-nucleotidase / UDP-sugar diphosphatase
VKLWIPVLAAAAIAAGCEADPKPAPQASAPSVLDVSAPPAGYQPSVSVYAAAPTPVAYAGPAYLPPAQAPAYVPPSGAVVVESPPADAPRPHKVWADKSTYTVKAGDTLYHIAKERYGDGKKWRMIAAANPDVTPTALRVGQRLVMP